MKSWLLTGSIAIFACCSLIGLAQEGTKPAKTAQAEKTDQPKGRLPAHYGKIGLTDAQKAKIYAVQGDYDDQLDTLVKQIADLKAKRDAEVEAVLTEDQRKILKNLLDSVKESKAKDKQDPTDAPKK
jgi:Spy/CpxP family protein refolding chaperone